jgi:hypothetical protein
MKDRFLELCNVWNEDSAMSNALQAALGRNRTYRDGSNDMARPHFRIDWARSIRDWAGRYNVPVADAQHCEAIRTVSDQLSAKFGDLLCDGRLRYGTSQKAFNLYLKFLWRLGKAAMPPHCPVDSIVLAEGRIDAAWTRCDDEKQYMTWVSVLREIAKPLSLAEWEYQVWLRSAN